MQNTAKNPIKKSMGIIHSYYPSTSVPIFHTSCWWKIRLFLLECILAWLATVCSLYILNFLTIRCSNVFVLCWNPAALSLDVIKVIPPVITSCPYPLPAWSSATCWLTCPTSKTPYPLLPSLAVWPINESLKSYREIPPPCSRLLRLSALMKTESPKNRRTGCLMNTYITKQAPRWK